MDSILSFLDKHGWTNKSTYLGLLLINQVLYLKWCGELFFSVEKI